MDASSSSVSGRVGPVSVDARTGAGLVFSIVLYVTPCSGGFGRECEVKLSPEWRIREFGPGLTRNARFLLEALPRALVLIYVPREECDISCVKDLQAQLRAFPNVQFIEFCQFDVAADTETRMAKGQKLRCARYLPMLTPPEGCGAVVVRDADSLLTHTDIKYVRKWLACHATWLVYQEYCMTEYPMGGGIACRVPLPIASLLPLYQSLHQSLHQSHILPSSPGLDSSLLLRHMIQVCELKTKGDFPPSDEGVLHALIPSLLKTAQSRRNAFREPPKLTPRDRAFMYVCTRMTRDGSYFVWNPRAGVCGNLLWPYVKSKSFLLRKPCLNDWIR